MPTRISSVALTVTSGGAAAITVPADAEGVTVQGTWWGNNSSGDVLLSSLVASFVSGGFTIRQLGASSQGAGKSGVYAAYGRVTATGSQTITPTYGWGLDAGPTFLVTFWKNIPPSGNWVRPTGNSDADPRVWQDTSGSVNVSGTIPSNSTDVVIALDSCDGGTAPGTPSGWTSVLTQVQNSLASRLRTANSPGASTTSTDTQTDAYATLSMLAIMDSGGGPVAPVLSAPVGTKTGSSTATVGATTDTGNGNRWTVVTTSATQPSVAQIKAGQDHTGAAAAWASGSVAVSTAGAFSSNATGLTPSTTYYSHSVQTNASAQDSNRVTSAAFTTDPPADTPPVVTITSVVVSGQNLTVSGTYTGIPTSAELNVGVADPANGAEIIGPVTVPYSGGTFSVTVNDVTPGSYLGPEVTMSNSGGSDTDQGGPFEVLGVDGDPDAPSELSQVESAAGADAPNRSLTATQSAAESAAGAETTSALIGYARSQAESNASADAPSRSLTASPSQAESAAGADAPSSAAARAGSQVESAAVADAPTAGAALAATGAETSGTGESMTASVDSIPINQSENAAAADTPTAAASMTHTQSEPQGSSDASSATQAASRSQVEAAAGAEATSSLLDLLASVAESASPADQNQAFVVTGVFTLELAAALELLEGEVSIIAGDQIEAVVVTDQQLATLVQAGAVAEVAVPNDETIGAIVTGTTVFENASAQDVTNILRYPYPRRTGPYAVRRFRIRYR